MNKKDLIQDSQRRKNLEKELQELQNLLGKFPVYWISALKGEGVYKALRRLFSLIEKRKQVWKTSYLNKLLEKIKENPILLSHNIKVYYSTYDPSSLKILLFTNKKVPPHIIRFIKHFFQKELDIEDLPLEVEIRAKKEKS